MDCSVQGPDENAKKNDETKTKPELSEPKQDNKAKQKTSTNQTVKTPSWTAKIAVKISVQLCVYLFILVYNYKY